MKRVQHKNQTEMMELSVAISPNSPDYQITSLLEIIS